MGGPFDLGERSRWRDHWAVEVSGLGRGTHTLTAKVIGNDGYGYFASSANSMNRLRLSDNTLNPGNDWPVAMSGVRLVPTAMTSSTGVNYYHMPAAIPGKFNPASPADFEDVVGYAANPGFSVGALSLDESKWYGVNADLGNVSVVDVATNTQVGTIAVGSIPQSAGVGPDGRLYVGNSGDSTISVIDTAADTVVATYSVAACPTPGSLGYLTFPEGEDYFYAACAQDGLVLKLGLRDGSLMGTFDIIAEHEKISALFISPDNKRLYASGLFGQVNGDRVAIVDATTGTVSTSIVLSGDSMSGTLTPDGQYIYAATQGATFDLTNIDVISTATGAIVASIDTSGVGVPGVVAYSQPSTATSDVTFTLGAGAVDESDPVVKDGELAATGTSQPVLLLSAIAVIGVTLIAARIKRVMNYRLNG